jgi:hypothetical protein
MRFEFAGRVAAIETLAEAARGLTEENEREGKARGTLRP